MMEVMVLDKQYGEAVNIYSNLGSKVEFLEHKVVATWIVCTALALDGERPCENYLVPLLDANVKQINTVFNTDILLHLLGLHEDQYPMDRLINALEIHDLLQATFKSMDYPFNEIYSTYIKRGQIYLELEILIWQ